MNSVILVAKFNYSGVSFDGVDKNLGDFILSREKPESAVNSSIELIQVNMCKHFVVMIAWRLDGIG